MKNKKSHRYDINRPRFRQWHKYNVYKVSHYDDPYMY